jgi:hypothetical protein
MFDVVGKFSETGYQSVLIHVNSVR